MSIENDNDDNDDNDDEDNRLSIFLDRREGDLLFVICQYNPMLFVLH